jgi:HEAT repeat protein
MPRQHRVTSLGIVAVVGVLAASTADATPRRWPRWPTELDRVVAPLRDDPAGGRDQDRVAALLSLEAFADPLVQPWVLHALGDPSSAVKREALRICFERELVACVPSALAIWSSVSEPMLRVSALRVVGIQPDGAGVDALLGALRDDNETMRAQAATVLGASALDPAARRRATAALLAKLGDLSAVVRQNAVEALGHTAEASATPAIARLLDDPEPGVRLATARSLGLIGDPSSTGALVRAIAAPNEPAVVRVMLFAIANLPGDAAVEALLAAFDEAPNGVALFDVAEAISLRADPEAALLDGLAQRVRDPVSSRVAVRTLAAHAEPGIARLERERRRGLRPELALEVDRLIEAHRVATQVTRAHAERPAPALHDPRDDLASRRGAPSAAAIADLVPLAERRDWGPTVDAVLQRGGAAEDHRVELALAATVGAALRLGRTGRRGVATLVRWARDPRTQVADRCLALLALAAVDRRSRGADDALAAAADLLAAADPHLRACAVVPWRALVRRADDRALLDPDARVRTVAAVVARSGKPSRAEASRLAVLAATDPDGRVRTAAKLVPTSDTAGVELVHGGALDPTRRWMALRGADDQAWMPTLAIGTERFAWVPRAAGLAPSLDD